MEDKNKEILDYSTLDRAPVSWQSILALITSFLIGFASLVLMAFAVAMLQDLLVGHVRDSHYSAWLYGVVPAGALAFIGIAVSSYGMCRWRTFCAGFVAAAIVNASVLLLALIFAVIMR